MALGDDLKRLWSLVRQLQGALDGKTIRSGRTTITFAASTSSAVTTVTHGLDTTPSQIVATAFDSPTFSKIPRLSTRNYTSTTFDISGEIGAAHTGDISVNWIGIW